MLKTAYNPFERQFIAVIIQRKKSIMTIRYFKFLIACAAVVLGGCGGGGGGGGIGGSTTLHIGVSYPQTAINLYSAATVTPIFTGFEGHTPNCALISGAVPSGMTLNSNCSISGTPKETGDFNFGIKIGADGVSNTINSSSTISVHGPSLAYPVHAAGQPGSHIGDAVNDSPYFQASQGYQGWKTPPGASWSYQMYAGALPPGFTLDQTTGIIAGVVTTQGLYNATIRATLNSAYGTYTVPISFSVNVGANVLSYSNAGATGNTIGYLNAYVSQPFVATPTENGPGSLTSFSLTGAALPAGLNLDPISGVISGTPTTTGPYKSSLGDNIPVAATVTSGGISSPTTGYFEVYVVNPIKVSYPINILGKVGSAMTVNPVIEQVSPIPVVGATFVYTARAPGATGCSLPPGMTLNSATGIVTGTPGSTGFFDCTVDIKITNNAISWVSPTQIYLIIN